MPHSWEEGRGGACSAPGARRSRSASLQSEWQLLVPCACAAMWVVLFTRTRDRCPETLLTTSAGDAWPALSFACNRKGESSQQLQVFPLWSGQGRGIRQTINLGVGHPSWSSPLVAVRLWIFLAEYPQVSAALRSPLGHVATVCGEPRLLPPRGGNAGEKMRQGHSTAFFPPPLPLFQ